MQFNLGANCNRRLETAAIPLPTRPDTERSWSVSAAELKAKNYDLKAVNPHVKSETDTRTPEDLYRIVEDRQKEIADAIARLRAL